MNETDLIKELEQTKEKLNRALRKAEGLKAKSTILQTQYTDSREREAHSNGLVMELLERQRELNVMLNRSTIMLNRAHEAMALTSVEFNEIAKALPEPKKAEWSSRISKINDLFKQSGMQEADVLGLDAPEPPSLKTDEMKRESEQAFSREESIWSRKERHEPPQVEAELLPEDHVVEDEYQPQMTHDLPELETVIAGEPEAEIKSGRRPWWHRITSD